MSVNLWVSRSVLRNVAPIAAACVVAGALAACGGSSSSGSGSGAGSTTARSSGMGKQITFALNSDPAPYGYDPFIASGIGQTVFWSGLYSSLFGVDSSGKIVPELAKTYSFNRSKTVLTMHLRSGVTFTDGTKLTAALVKANLARRSDNSLASYHLFANGGAAEIKSVATPDSSTVVITFAHPEASAPEFLSTQAGWIVGGKAVANPKLLDKESDGSGPYVLDASETQAGNSYTLNRNPKSWQASTVHFNQMVFNVVADDQARASALVSGQAQVSELLPSTLSVVKSNSDLSIVGYSGQLEGLIESDKLGKLSKPFGSLLVRQALQMSIDRSEFAKLNGETATGTASLFPVGSPGYDPGLDAKYAYNLARAKALLAKAGYPHGFTFKMVEVGTEADANLAALQESWKRIGVNLVIDRATSFAAGLKATQTTPAGFASFNIDNDPLGWTSVTLLGSGLNPQHVQNASINAALNEAEAGSGDSDIAALKKLNAAVVNQGWYFPMFDQDEFVGYNHTTVASLTPGEVEYTLLTSIRPAS